MPSRFGLRQIITLAILLACSVLIAIALVQNNRRMAAQPAPNPATIPSHTSATEDPTDWARPGIPIATIEPRHWAWPWSYAPEPGGTVVEALESSPQTLTPFFATDAQARRVIQDTVCQTLGRIDPATGLPRALVADAWQFDPDGLWLRVRLDETARFSDGSPVTAADVKFSLDILRSPGLDAQRTSSVVEGIESIEVISDRVAEFRFKEPRPLNALHALCSLYIVPKHFYDQFTPDQLNQSTGLLLGSGPFMLKDMDVDNKWRPGADIVLVPNPHNSRALIDSLRFTTITDPTARLTALRNGDIHIMRGSPDQLSLMKADPEFTAHDRIITDPAIGSSYSAIAWNCAAPSILVDERVRLAMTHLLDRQRIVDEMYAGAAAIATSPFPVNSPMNDPSIAPWPFDPARASALLDEAGWTTRNPEGVRTDADGRALDIDLAIPQGSRLAEFVALMLKDQAAKAGIRIRITTADMAAIAAMQREGDFDGAIVGWSHGLPENEPRQQWHSASIDDGDNIVRFSSPEADDIISRGEREMDPAARMELWRQLHHVLHDDQPFTFLVNPPWIRIISKSISCRITTTNGFDYEVMELTPNAPGGSP